MVNNLTKMAAGLICLFISLTAMAQEQNDARYLEGAVPLVNGKVIFSHEYSLKGMSQDEIYDSVLAWMEQRLKKNENNSRILYTNKEKGQIIGIGEEWIVFKKSALSLDRTFITYQLTVTCQPNVCNFSIEKIRYEYREGEEKYTAEDWITDKYALNKSKTKLVRGLAKWRRKTIDFVDTYFNQLGEVLSPESVQTVQQALPSTTASEQKTVPQQTTQHELKPEELTTDMIPVGTGKLVIVIGTDLFNQTIMTANSGGSLGEVDGKAVIFTILSPEQPHTAMDKASEYNVRFYPNGATQPSIELQCRKMPPPEVPEGMPRTYVGEIVKAIAFQ